MAFSTQRAVSDGTLQLLMIEIEFFDKSEITAYFDNIPTTAFVWATDKSIRFDVPVPNGIEVLVRRTTDLASPRHIFSDGAQFKASTLDEDFKQILHIAQEAVEGANVGDIYQPLNMHGNPILNVGPTTSDNDAVSLGQVKVESQTAWVAANQAAASAASAGVASSTAVTQAGIATDKAAIATTQAGIATTAVNSIGTSVAQAAASASTASTAQVAASNSATLAQQWAAQSEDVVVSGGLYSAFHYSRKASASASAAAASAASVNLPAFAGNAGRSLVVNAAANAWELVTRVTTAAFDAVVARVATLEAGKLDVADIRAPRALGRFTSGASPALVRGFGISAISRPSTGVYLVDLSAPITNPIMLVTANSNPSGSFSLFASAETTTRIRVVTYSGGGFTDALPFCLQVN